MANNRQAAGKEGEGLAVAALQQAGYHIVARNWRDAESHGEIDVIAHHNGQLVFVEVRARRTLEAALQSLGPHKQAQLQRLAQAYLATHDPETAHRIDYVAVGLADASVEIIFDAASW
jgi:putative endonuclease